MKKAVIILAFFLSTGAAARADSYFLSAFEFYLHYPENSIIYKTANQGISQNDYLDFLIAADKPLGDKVALIGALSTYYEFHDDDKSDDFKKYTTRFKQHIYNRITRLDPSEALLLETLMDDYQTFTPNTNQYNRLADKMPESLTAQSVRVIARAYDILYNRKWNEVSEFENDNLNPYLQSWQNCRQDINPKVRENVEWWLFYIYQSRADDMPELEEEVMQKFAHLFMSVSSGEDAVAVEEGIQEEQENSSQIAIELPPINEQFTSYFPDMVLGKHAVKESAKLIPQQVVAEFFPDFAEAEKEPYTKIYLHAVGKILNYKGLDLYICDYDYERPDEDSYDNHTDSIRILLLFKNNIPLKDEYGKRQIKGMNFHYYGEGGESNSNTYFDTDTTLVCYEYSSESESATGFDTPFIHTKKWRSVLNGDGEREITEILQMEYSSPFYDCKYLKEKEKEWADVESDGFNYRYPTHENKKYLVDENIPVYCTFHIETTDTIENVRFLPVFETYYGSDLIDRYIVGQPRSNILSESSNIPQPIILKCPFIIKTSDGDLEMLPDRKFRIRDNKIENGDHKTQIQNNTITLLKL
ncbi:hypothetical protein FACS1894182_11670 [Bacteroidia bacterium]|nr:hypothetical protein FACS1894182_11670 [Bacteroidia bacterium]